MEASQMQTVTESFRGVPLGGGGTFHRTLSLTPSPAPSWMVSGIPPNLPLFILQKRQPLISETQAPEEREFSPSPEAFIKVFFQRSLPKQNWHNSSFIQEIFIEHLL